MSATPALLNWRSVVAATLGLGIYMVSALLVVVLAAIAPVEVWGEFSLVVASLPFAVFGGAWLLAQLVPPEERTGTIVGLCVSPIASGVVLAIILASFANDKQAVVFSLPVMGIVWWATYRTCVSLARSKGSRLTKDHQ